MNPDEVYAKYQKDFAAKIEEMPQSKLRIIFSDAWNAVMPAITTLPHFGDVSVDYTFNELTAICPMTALPDSYTLTIHYIPNEKVPELKSLRNYLLAYRNLPIIHELLLTKIRGDFEKAVEPKELDVTLDVAVRGGIKTQVRG